MRWPRMELVDINEWASGQIKTICVTQYVKRNGGGYITYPIKVRRFVPTADDSLARRWKFNGVEELYECAPYAIADMTEAGRMMERVVDNSLLDAILSYVDKEDTLLHKTYMMAYGHSRTAEVCLHVFGLAVLPFRPAESHYARD